ncbi:S24 family peptidase [Achromobacter denitrificans]|uniref:S24 family peptidase n=1 Tax=Achromobacter denitrificans TaxID=32002 RepID=UPI0023E40C0B|nr:S24 family peptidase [Achromobacter denitrificans]MDF3939947.1 S24 family peptidase [Achromobacter denitrificans]
MNEIELNEFRIGRLSAAVDHVSNGNKTDFGRRLGYKDGAFVRQMLSGIRPVTEKTIWAIEAMPGMKGWFDVEGVETPAAPAPDHNDWPFKTIAAADVRALPASQLAALEGALALAIAQLKIGLNVSPPPAPQPAVVIPLRANKPGGLVDIDHADDAFPMRIPGLPPAPWEGGRTTHQAETERPAQISTQAEVFANVGPGEPHAANDEFEEVPELADVRLAAGDGIENHSEEQTGVVLFRKSFLRSVGADNGRGRVVYAKGDSMDPDIKDGWALLVVPSDCLTPKDLIPGEFYAVNYDGKMIVKLIEKDNLTGRWVAKSTNKSYRDIPLENGASVRILGPVAWAGGRLTARNAGKWAKA